MSDQLPLTPPPTPLTDADIAAAQTKAKSMEEIDRLGALRLQLAATNLKQAIADFRVGTLVYLNIIERIENDIKEIGFAPGMEELLGKLNQAHLAMHENETLSLNRENDIDGKTDLDTLPFDPDQIEKPLPEIGPITSPPKPSTVKHFTPDLAAEYVSFFQGMQIKPEHRDLVAALAQKALQKRMLYENVGAALAIPWWFIAGIHMLESSFNTKAHLHNGDPLTKRTVRVPAGRPRLGSPPFSWEESALDALQQHGFANLTDWSLPRALHRWERFNGVGYRSKRIPTPYLWSFSTLYNIGKFVADRRFDKNATSKQCGAAVLLRHLHDRGELELSVDLAGAPSQDSVGSDNLMLDDDVGSFGQFWKAKLADVIHFGAKEFLIKGGKNAENKLNTDPPERLFLNVVPLVRAMEVIRKEIGRQIRINSAYRSPAYNALVGGAKHSQHMLFTACDFTVVGDNPGRPKDWAAVVRRVRDSRLFSGGIGTYTTSNFVHVDVRGHNVNWGS